MAQPVHETEALADAIRQEVASDAAALSRSLMAEVLPDTQRVARPKYLQWVRSQWLADPGFSLKLLERLAPTGPTGQRPEAGLRRYIADVEEAFRTAPGKPPDAYHELAAQAIAQSGALEDQAAGGANA